MFSRASYQYPFIQIIYIWYLRGVDFGSFWNYKSTTSFKSHGINHNNNITMKRARETAKSSLHLLSEEVGVAIGVSGAEQRTQLRLCLSKAWSLSSQAAGEIDISDVTRQQISRILRILIQKSHFNPADAEKFFINIILPSSLSMECIADGEQVSMFAADVAHFLQVTQASLENVCQELLPVASKVSGATENDFYPLAVGHGLAINCLASRTNFLTVLGYLLPLLRCSSSDARGLLRLLQSLGLAVGDRWRWFAAIMPAQLVLGAEDSIFLWGVLFETDWDPSGVEIVAVASRIWAGSLEGVRHVLQDGIPHTFVERFLMCPEGESLLRQMRSESVRAVCRQWALCKSVRISTVVDFFPNVGMFSDALASLDTLPGERRLFLCDGFRLFGARIPVDSALGVVRAFRGSPPKPFVGTLLRVLLTFEERADALALSESLCFSPYLIPFYLKWDFPRPSLWGEDIDELFLEEDIGLACDVLSLMAPFAETSSILVAFARSKRKMQSEGFLSFLECIGSMRHSPTVLDAITRSTGADSRAAALTLWHNASEDLWDSTLCKGVVDLSEGGVWSLATAARLHTCSFQHLSSVWPADVVRNVFSALLRLRRPLTLQAIENILGLGASGDTSEAFASVVGDGETPHSLVSLCSPDEPLIREIVSSLSGSKRPSQGFGLAPTATRFGIELGNIPQLLARIRPQLIMHVLFQSSFTPDALSLSLSLSFCDSDPKQWSNSIRKHEQQSRISVRQHALEILDKLGERLGRIQHSRVREALVFRAVRNLIVFLGQDVQSVANKILSLLFSKQESASLHVVLFEVVQSLVRAVGPDYWNTRGDSLIADCIEVLPLLSNPESYRAWLRTLNMLHERTSKAKFWGPILIEASLPSPLLALLPSSQCSTNELCSIVELLGTTSHTYRRIILSSFVKILRNDNSKLSAIGDVVGLLIGNLLECLQVPLLASLSAEVLGVLGPLGSTRATVVQTRGVDDLLCQALNWRKFAFAILGQHCPSAIEAASTADAHDQIAFAVQEVIRTGAEQERSNQMKHGLISRAELDGYSWWSDLSLRQRDRYQVYLSTNYSIPKSNAPSAFERAFREGLSASLWCRQLSRSLAFGAHELFRDLFKSTRALAVADRSRMFDLLPLFVLHNVLQVPDSLAYIADEINLACTEGGREHVVVAIALVDLLHRARDRILLSDKLAKQKIKEVEDFPFGGRVQSLLSLLDTPRIVAAAVSFGFDPHAVRLLESSRALPNVSGLGNGLVVSLKKAFSNLHDPHSVTALRELAPPRVATVEDLELENDFDGCARFALECLAGAGVASAPEPLLLSFARSSEMAGMPSTSISILKSVASRSESLQHYLNEAAWRLGQWDGIRDIATPGLCQPVMSLVHGTSSTVQAQLSAVSSILSTVASHTDCVPDQYLVMLGALEDIRFVEENRQHIDKVRMFLATRMESAWGYRNPEPLRSLHGIMYKMLGADDSLGSLWVGQARHSLQMEDFEGAISAARRVGSLGLKDEYHTEMANILSKMGRKTEAIQFAQHSVPNVSPECASLLKARSALWGHELNFYTAAHTTMLLAEAVKQHGSHESFELLGLFHYNMFSTARSAAESVGGSQGVKDMYRAMEGHALPGMLAFGRAVTMNRKHVMEAIPRLVTMWLDGNATLYSLLRDGRLRGYDPDKLTADTTAVVSRLPSNVFLASVGHLLSRLSTQETSASVASTLVKLMQAHPQPILWQVLAAALSNPATRATTIQGKILAPFVESGGKDALTQFKCLFSCLTQICRGTIQGNKLGAFEPVRKLMPLLSASKFLIPSIRSLHPSYSTTSSSFFFTPSPHIHSFGDQVDVINSLQKPKRIVIVDSAGSSHFYLMKAKDDPRKDIRMMEIATHINNVFIRGSSRATDALALQCYAVLALCDDCALIEWVDGTATIRRILDETYVVDGTGVKISEVQGWKEACDKGKISKIDLFTKYIFPAAPPVLHQWFQRSFAHTLQWYRARSLYTQSCAVWSMCGHIVGLGDRHAENLLVSLDSGQAMHVDFACMFDKGETLRVPETVRFRLTPNVVDGFGITGTFGPFTNCCERALSVISDHKDIVEGVLETFIYDPLLEWSSKDGRTDPKALIRRCRRRLDGYMDFYGSPKDEVPLSISGQVRALINHNSRIEVLSEMYIWWMVWL